MMYAIILIFVALILSIIASILINRSPTLSSCPGYLHDEFATHKLLRDWSIENATLVNHSQSQPSRPVRPQGETFFDGLVSEVSKDYNIMSLARRIINIRSTVSIDNFQTNSPSLDLALGRREREE